MFLPEFVDPTVTRILSVEYSEAGTRPRVVHVAHGPVARGVGRAHLLLG